jgi:regulator of protease activity HflC (stomatin/prohibitin superfamily)
MYELPVAETTSTLTYIIYVAIFLIGIILIMMWGLPKYSVYASRKRGEAELAEANFAEQVAIAQATARKNSAKLNKEAEIIDAEAVAESIAKIGDALKNNAGYLQWQWIKNIADTDNEVIYVPTEANIPIMEAGKRY